MAKGIWSSLKSVFTSEPEPPAPVEPNPAAAEDEHWVELTLDQLLAAEPDSPAHLISLHAYREALGEHWDKLGPKVMMLAESIIRRLTRYGGMIFQREDCFVILFKLPFRPRGPLHVAEAAAELGQRLVGAKFSAGAAGSGPSITVGEIKGSDILGEGGTLDVSKLKTAAAAAPPLALPPPAVEAVAPGAAPPRKKDPEAPASAMPAEWTTIDAEATTTQVTMTPIAKKNAAPTEISMVPIQPRKAKRPDPQWVPISKDK
jgi:hypothetical protein